MPGDTPQAPPAEGVPVVPPPAKPVVVPPVKAPVPPAKKPDLKPDPVKAAESAAKAAGGAGEDKASVAITFKLRAISQDEQKTVSFSYSSSKAVQRTYAPQSLFGLLASDLRREDYFVEVDLDDPFFRTFKVTAEVPFEISRIGLRSINVGLDYGDPADPPNHKHGDLIFDSSTPTSQSWEVFVNNALDLGFTPRIEYNFNPQSDWQGERYSYTVEPGWTMDRSLELNPYDFLGFLEVQVLPSGLDAQTFSSVDVDLAYLSASGWSVARTVVVTPTSAPQAWRVRTDRPHDSTFRHTMTYHLISGGTFVTEEVTTRAASVVVDNPFVHFVQPQFRFTFAPGRFTEVRIAVTHDEPDTGYHHNETISVDGTATEARAQRFGVLPGGPDPASYSFRVQLLGEAGAMTSGPLVTTTEQLVSIDETGQVVTG